MCGYQGSHLALLGLEVTLESGRRLARRRMGRIAFASLLIQGFAVLAGVFLGGDAWAANLRAAEGVLLGLFWTETAIVGLYLGASGMEAIWKRKG